MPRAWLRPVALCAGADAAALIAVQRALPLAGGGIAFTHVEMLARRGDGSVAAALASIDPLRDWAATQAPGIRDRIEGQLAALTEPRRPWAGLRVDRPLVMGIVNVTPDSFSDGGAYLDAQRAVEHGRALLAAGADILDIGGESTRPGALPVAPEEEIRRIEPVVRALGQAGAVVSIDTRHAAVMDAGLSAGARIVNDVSALSDDPDSLALVARRRAPVVLMHKPGAPRTMQLAPSYELASLDVAEYLAARIATCAEAGIDRADIVIDPGIGFGKLPPHNQDILRRVGLLHALGCRVLLGISRKSLIGDIDDREAPKQRLPGSLTALAHAATQGVQIFRVHDVAETRQAIEVWRRLGGGGPETPG